MFGFSGLFIVVMREFIDRRSGGEFGMRRLWKNIIAGMIAAVFVISGFNVYVFAENSKSAEEKSADAGTDGQMNMDFVFVLDDSGSMFKSDPEKISKDAYSLFTELMDETCGVGYVAFTHQIVGYENIVDVSDAKKVQSQKKKVMDLEYDNRGYTDISLALKQASKMLTDKRVKDNGRQKCIVLLTDGNTNLVRQQRTTEESLKELDEVLKTLSDLNIPVYSIGLNSNGKLNRDEIDKISGNTDGKSFEVTDSKQLLDVFISVFGSVNKMNGNKLDIVNGSVKIDIPNSSVFSTSIIIQSAVPFSEMNPVLTNPKGEEVSLSDSDKIRVSSAKSYVLIKIIFPENGTWVLNLDNVSEDKCKILQMDYYSLYVSTNIKNSASVGRPLQISASVGAKDGTLNDEDLLKYLKATAIIVFGDKTEIVELERNGGSFSGEWEAKKAGKYNIKVMIDAGRFQKVSKSVVVNVTDSSGPVNITPSDYTNSNLAVDDESIDRTVIIVSVVSGIMVLIIVAGIIIIRKVRKNELKREEERIRNGEKINPPPPPVPEPKPAPAPRPAPVIEKVKPMPKPTDPEYVDYERFEHDSLENLIKKGPEDAFAISADTYKTDAALEALIKKGPDNTFGVGKDESTYDDEDEDDDEYEDDEYEDDDE